MQSTVMQNDDPHSSHEWPKPKKSKTDVNFDQVFVKSGWDSLPAIIIDNIFQYLNVKDTISAASTCQNWRHGLYHPRKWVIVNFVINRAMLPKAQYLRKRASRILTDATIKFDSFTGSCVKELLLLLNDLSCNNNLQSIILEPTNSVISVPPMQVESYYEHPVCKAFVEVYKQQTPRNLNIGCNEELSEYLEEILESIVRKKPENLTMLAVATIKEDPSNYPIQNFNTKYLSAFRNLQILSIDYDNLDDDLLGILGGLNDFRRLVVHVHGIWESHPNTSEEAWTRLVQKQPNCRLRLSFIHSIDEVRNMHIKVFRKNMPLSHLKVLYCEHMNLNALRLLPNYQTTFVSLMWIDHFSNADCEIFIKEPENIQDIQPPELVIVAWLCRYLEEIVLLGYKFREEEWLGIAKLRGDTLKRFQFAKKDLVKSTYKIYKELESTWAPLPDSAIHPTIWDPLAGYTDEYLMPLLLADLH